MFKLQYIRIYLFLILGVNFFIWLMAYFIYTNINHSSTNNNLIILHYNTDFGIDLIGNIKKIFILSLISVIIALINVFLTFLLTKHKHFKFIAHLLLLPCIIIGLFLSLSLMSIYLVN